MATDIIARGMASNAESKAQQAIDELSMVVEGRMNAEETEFTDLDGNVVVPDTETVYLDVDTYVYYRYNGTEYYPVSDPRGTVRYTAQTATSSEKAQARENIGAQEELSSGVNVKTINGESILGSGNIDSLSNIAPQYDATAEYAVDDLVLQNNILYECNTPITTPEAFDPSKWTRTTIAQVFKRFQFTTVQ